MATVFAELKKVGGTCLSIVVRHDHDFFFFLIFNEMFVLEKCILKMGTLVREPNLRVVLMFLVWMRDLNWAFPHPTSIPKHQPAVYFGVGRIAVHDV